MDNRFPKWLRFIVNKLDFLALPNLGGLICGLAVLAFLARTFFAAPMDRFLFDPELVMQGEWWRIFSFPVSEGLDNPIWLLFYVMYVYFVMNALEAEWGPGPVTVYILLGYLSALGAAFVTGRPISIWFHILENISLAFGTLFPEVEFYLFLILPVKAKWLAVLAGVLLVLQFATANLNGKIFLLMVMFPYLLFFSPLLYQKVRMNRQVIKNRRRFDKDMWK